MQAHFFEKLRLGISAPRLDVYRTPGDSDFEVIAKYFWNIALGESLYPALHTLEVALRNTIHQAAIGRFHDERWFEPPISRLHPQEQAGIDLAKAELNKRREPLEPDRIVSELAFGFWVSLLNARYEPVLWPPMLLPTFPNLPRTMRTRKTLSTRFNDIRALRNRVFHHERISHWPNLAKRHGEILEAIGWISPELSQALSLADRFLSVYTTGLERIRCKLDEIDTPSASNYVI